MKNFLESGKYLPPFLRDFHDQKDVFKTLWGGMDLSKFPKEIQALGWINFHILIIDLFLWWMAKRGWTLQRSRQNVEFLDVHKDIEEFKCMENESFKAFMKREQSPDSHK